MTSFKTSKTLFDLNSLLSVANVLICGLSIYLYNVKGKNDFINIDTLLLLGLVAIENIGMLAYEKRKRNPFIIILVFMVTLFYMARIATIIHIPISASLAAIDIITTAEDINYAILFIIVSNASMFLGFYIGDKNKIIRTRVTCSNDNTPKIYKAMIIICLLMLVDFFGLIDLEILGRLTGYIQAVFFQQHIILLFTLTFLVFYYNKLSLQIRTQFIVIMLAVVLLITLRGSRSAILTVGTLLMMAILVVKQRVMISKKIILICLIIVPISFIFFVIATFRQQLGRTGNVTLEDLHMVKEYDKRDLNRIEDHLARIYYRLGYLDWSTQLIANKQRFAQVINGQYYIDSIIDNVLTPGFDLFGTVMVAHTLSYIKRGESLPDRDRVAQHYQSDQMGIYGEYYVLFYGYPALAAFFFCALVFQRIFINLKTKNVLRACLYRAVLLYLFYIWTLGFGVDWFALEIVTAVIATFLFSRFYISNRKRVSLTNLCMK